VYGGRTSHFDDILDEIFKSVGENLTINVDYIEKILKWDHKIEDSALILLNDLSNLQYLNSHAKLVNQSPKTLKFVIYCKNNDNLLESSSLKFYQSDSPEISSFEYFIVNDNSTISLKTFDYFTANSCNQKLLKTLNFFNKTTQKWKEPLKDYKNFENFNGCMLTVTDEYNVYLHITKYNSEIIKCFKPGESDELCLSLFFDIMSRPDVGFRGITYEIFEILGKHGNFITNYQFSDNSYVITKTRQIIYQVITIYRAGQYEEFFINTHMSTMFFDISVGIFVSPPEFYTNFEKLLLPFDDTTWILLLAIFSTTAIFIFVMKLMPEKLRISFYGDNILSPGLNSTQIFFGISLTKLPTKSTSRFILIVFVLFCLILRSCYQSKMFDFITSDMRKPLPRTLEEVIEHGYTIVLLDYSTLYQNLYDEVRRRSRR
jgi:hypothetical protein